MNDAWLEMNGDGDTDFDVDTGSTLFELLGGPAHHAGCVNHGLCAVCALAPIPDGYAEPESECASAICDVRVQALSLEPNKSAHLHC